MLAIPAQLTPALPGTGIRNRHHLAAACRRLAVLVLLALALGACGSKRVTLHVGLNDSEANEMVLILNRQGIEARKDHAKDGVSLQVDEKDLSRASAVLKAAGLPRRKFSSLGEIFKRQGMISSPLEERVRYIHGLSEELGFTLQQFDHVVSARVHVVLPERVAPGEPILPSSAAVFVKFRPPMDEDAAVPRIRNLISSSIPGLSGEEGRAKVSVVLIPAEASPPPVEWTKVGPLQVQAASAGSVTAMFGALLVLMLVVMAVVLREAARRNQRVAALVARYVGPAAALAARMAETARRRRQRGG